MKPEFDVAIVGGGPAGTVTGSVLRKHAPQLRVLILEREHFPREHVGESLLPPVCAVLNEIDAWDKVEAANFPIKVGATYRWGISDDLWDFNLVVRQEIGDTSRPGRFEGWRKGAAWQVDRALYDKILLEHAAELGCEVRQACSVSKIIAEGDEVKGLQLGDGSVVTARHYVDGSGVSGLFRRSFDIAIDEPPSLKNVALWDYWENAKWAVQFGETGTRIQVMSLGFGWIWFIPLSPTRTSIGLVCPSEYVKRSRQKPEELYRQALLAEPRIAALLEAATPEGNLRTTKDWSFVSKRMVGANWFLAGDSGGFADPILSAGMTIAYTAARECAYSILELERGRLDRKWILAQFEERQIHRILQHIRFAAFWYSANAHFHDLMEFTGDLARESGFKMEGKSAWQWFGSGEFVSLDSAGAGLAGHNLERVNQIHSHMTALDTDWLITHYNLFHLDLEGAVIEETAIYHAGKILPTKVYRRDGKSLPVVASFALAIEALKHETALDPILRRMVDLTKQYGPKAFLAVLQAFEAMLQNGWVRGECQPGARFLRREDIPESGNIDWNRD